jgi:hypothetical protein
MKVRISIVALAFLVVMLICTLAMAQGQVHRSTAGDAADQKEPMRIGLYASAGEMMSLGSVWQVTECCGWSGTWTRRAGTNTFDARWRHTNGSQAQDVITLQSWSKTSNEIVLQRPSINGTYRATVNPSARTLTDGTASWYPAGEKWSARY